MKFGRFGVKETENGHIAEKNNDIRTTLGYGDRKQAFREKKKLCSDDFWSRRDRKQAYCRKKY